MTTLVIGRLVIDGLDLPVVFQSFVKVRQISPVRLHLAVACVEDDEAD